MVWCGTAALAVHEQWQWVCCFPQVNRFLMIWGTVAHTTTQSWVSYISHGSPAVAGSCDKWLTLDCVWVCCAAHMSIHHCHYYHWNRHRNLWDGQCVSSWRPLVWLGHSWQFVRVYIYIYNCVFGSLISDVTCNYVSADGGRDGLWWPALPGHWLSYTGCWLSLLIM